MLAIISSVDLYVTSNSARSYSLGNPDSASSSFIYMMVSGNIDACTEAIFMSGDVLSMPIKLLLTSFFDYIYWPVVISSFFQGFDCMNIFPSALQNSWDIKSNIVIKGSSSSNRPFMVNIRVVPLQPPCHGLDGAVLARKNEQNRKIHPYISRVFFVFTFFMNK